MINYQRLSYNDGFRIIPATVFSFEIRSLVVRELKNLALGNTKFKLVFAQKLLTNFCNDFES